MTSTQANPHAEPWPGKASEVAKQIEVRRRQCLGAYREDPLLVQEHFKIERQTAEGGYGRRQLYELVQNGADAILEAAGSRVEVLLTADALYCANEGKPIDGPGLDSILHSSLSNKRGNEIGRFGVGFKSVLGVTSAPQFFSLSGSFGFDASWAAEEIRRIVPQAAHTPVLRLAFPLDPVEEASKDGDLARLMSWAASVVKLPISEDGLRLLQQDVLAFPPEFVLFCSHVRSLVLADRVSDLRREITVSEVGNDFILDVKGTPSKTSGRSRWRIFNKMHPPSPTARKDAGELAERDLIPITWAVPLEGRPGSGHFWAFFPTEYETSLSGIINAPWKTNEDRQNLLRGDFNDELISVTAELVVDSLQELTRADSPGSVLDYLPGRSKEQKGWADIAINERVYHFAAQTRCLPDQKGILRSLQTLKVPPADLPEEALSLWSDCPQKPEDWTHKSCETRERRSRVDRLLDTAGVVRRSLKEWLEGLLGTPPGAISSGAACQIGAVLTHQNHQLAREVLQCTIVLTTDGRLVQPLSGKVFLPGITPAHGSTVAVVHTTLSSFTPYRKALLELGIGVLDAKEQLTAFLRSHWHYSLADVDAKRFWELAATLPPSDVSAIFKSLNMDPMRLQVQTLYGPPKKFDEALLPGEVVGDGKTNLTCTIDVSKYPNHNLLSELGARSKPGPNRQLTTEAWFSEYRSEAVNLLFEQIGAGRRPYASHLEFDRSTGLGPMSVLKDLDLRAASRFTTLALEYPLDSWQLKHNTQAKQYPSITFSNPALWFIRKYGALETSLGPMPTDECVAPSLGDFASLLPIARCTARNATDLGLPNELGALRKEVWVDGLRRAQKLDDDEAVGRFYGAAAQFSGIVPETIRCRVRNELRLVAPSEAVAVATRSEYSEMVRHDVPAVLAGDRCDLLVSKWSLQTPSHALKRAVHPVPLGPEQAIGDRFPLLRLLAEDQIQNLTIQYCESLRLEVFRPTGRSESEIDFFFDGRVFFVGPSLSALDTLRRIADALQLGLSDADLQGILQAKQNDERARRKESVLAAPTPLSRFGKAVGPDAVKSKLPSGLLQAVEREHGRPMSGDELCRLADAVYGVELLRTFKEELDSAGLEPPVQWAGSFRAKRFVRLLGFPASYAGFEGARHEPLVQVAGPPNLPELHDFQREITVQIKGLMRRQNGSRGLLSLPTGAGKTRVAVQAIVEEIRDSGFRSPVVWIAQSDELCEQAVQTWTEVWRALGARAVLSISRLWGANEADAVEDGPHVVIATIDKLRGCVDDPAYDFLTKASSVVVDEAHTSVAPEYTLVLEWLGLTRRDDRCPLLGLTATPFRGRSEEETKRLVSRYGKRRLDTGALGEDPYAVLQQMGVLARVKHKLLAGISVDLSLDELAQLKAMGGIPASVRERIGADPGRNQGLLRSIQELPKDWPVLLFASSVSHAQTMAALLNMEGIRAASVSAETDSAVRRYYVDEFRAGGIRVLTNYGVLTQGFDAPAVRALYVARPTYSPNLYQQMIGRGLRGPMNGGKAECLIINVEDNLAQYGEKLAFTQFEYLWS